MPSRALPLLPLVVVVVVACASSAKPATSAPTATGPTPTTSAATTVTVPPSAPGVTTTTTTAGTTLPTNAGTCHSTGGLPDRACTPGAIDPRVTQANIQSTICQLGYTATVRPPAAYTEALKRTQLVQYGEPGPLSAYEEDHLVPLEVGGAPSDPRNLWPQPRTGPPGETAADKDQVESRQHDAVCAGTTTLAAAQAIFMTDWRKG